MNAPLDMNAFARQVCGMGRTPAYMLGSEVSVNFRGLDLLVELDYENCIEEISTECGADLRSAFADWALDEIKALALAKRNEKESA